MSDFHVRDQRKPGHHWADNEIIDEYISKIGVTGYAIYMYLGRWAGNRTGECIKTQSEVASALDLSRETVNRYIAILSDEKLIEIQDHGANKKTYVLLEVPKALVIKSDKPLSDKVTRVSENITRVLDKVTSNKEERLSSKLLLNNPLPPLEKQEPSAENQKPIELDKYSAAKSLGELIGVGHSSGRGLHRLTSAIEQAERRWPEKNRNEVIYSIRDLWKEYCAQGLHAPVSILNWLESLGSYIDSDHWRKKKKPEFKPQIDWQGGHIGEDGVYRNKHGKKVPGFICPPKPKNMAGD